MPAAFSAMLLAGGRSTRMGRDKALLDWQGCPLWQMQLDKLEMLSPLRLIVSCREEQNLHQYKLADVEWLFDPPGSDCGPMGPVITALEAVNMPLLVLAVDMPNMSPLFLEKLLFASDQAAFCATEDGIEPLTGFYSPRLLPLLKEAFDAQRYSLRRVLEQGAEEGLVSIRPMSETEAPLFANTNTPTEWGAVTARG